MGIDPVDARRKGRFQNERPDNSIQLLRKQVIEAKDRLEHARYRLDALELIFEGLKDERAQAAAQEVFGLAKEKLNEVNDGLDNIYPELSGLQRDLSDERG